MLSCGDHNRVSFMAQHLVHIQPSSPSCVLNYTSLPSLFLSVCVCVLVVFAPLSFVLYVSFLDESKDRSTVNKKRRPPSEIKQQYRSESHRQQQHQKCNTKNNASVCRHGSSIIYLINNKINTINKYIILKTKRTENTLKEKKNKKSVEAES